MEQLDSRNNEMLGIQKQIIQKTNEIENLEEQYNKEAETDKKKVKSKNGELTKSLYLLGFNFESSGGRTPQYLEFHRTFKREFTNLLKPLTKEISISKPNHFDLTGFFKLNDDRIYYFSIGDLRWNKWSMLIRTAKDFKDYTGGSNNKISIDSDFVNRLLEFLKRDKGWL